MTTPTTAAIKAAREREASYWASRGAPITADMMRDGRIDPNQALAIALQEMSDAVKAKRLDGPNCGFTPFILPDPVDPLLIEARKLCKKRGRWGKVSIDYESGLYDETPQIQDALTALRRGMELAQVQP